jgi:hypothetical protein
MDNRCSCYALFHLTCSEHWVVLLFLTIQWRGKLFMLWWSREECKLTLFWTAACWNWLCSDDQAGTLSFLLFHVSSIRISELPHIKAFWNQIPCCFTLHLNVDMGASSYTAFLKSTAGAGTALGASGGWQRGERLWAGRTWPMRDGLADKWVPQINGPWNRRPTGVFTQIEPR